MTERTDQPEIKHLKKRTLISLLSLFFQSGYSAFLGLVANIVLSILLSPATFGMYITVLALISFLNYFSDIGLAASLIQKENVDETDKTTVFTVQQILILSLILFGFLGTKTVSHFYQLNQNGIDLYHALLIAFYISSLKTIPSIMLERNLQFNKIALVQIIENTAFYLTVIVLAFYKLELVSFTFAVLLRAVVGLIVMYKIYFWKPKLKISFSRLKKLLHFGVSFQTSSLLALFKDDLMTLFLSKTLGFAGVGYIGWAKKWAEAPIRIVMDNLSKVLFPLLSRIQEEKQKIAFVLEKMFYYQNLLLAPMLTGMILVMHNFVLLIPKYQKWEPALPIFYLFAISALLLTYSLPFINFFNALGKSSISLFFMIVWTAITWIFVPILIKVYGLVGYPMVHVLIALTFVFVLRRARKFIDFHFWRPIKAGILSSLIMALTVSGVKIFLPITWLNTGGEVLIGILSYIFSLAFIFQISFLSELKAIFKLENE